MTSEVEVDCLKKDGTSSKPLEPKQPVPAHIRAGRILFSRCRGQPFHIARILMVDTIRLRCYMRFEDGTTHWCRFCNIQNFSSSSTLCCLCNEIVANSCLIVCIQCQLGFHPQCHNPTVPVEELASTKKWNCRVCTFSDTSMIDGLPRRVDNSSASCLRQTSSHKQKDSLDWDKKHQMNKQNVYCYCRKPGQWSSCMLQCLKCLQWFHYACILSLKTKPVGGDALFVFVCSACIASGQEYLRRIQTKWIHIVQLALYRLQNDRNELEKRKRPTTSVYFDIRKDIMPWLHRNWNQLLTGKFKNNSKEKREARVTAVLKNHPKRFLKYASHKKNGPTLWSLKRDRPPMPPKIWLPDNGTLLTAKFLDRVVTEMGIKCVQLGKLVGEDSERNSRNETFIRPTLEKDNPNSDTNCSSHSTETSGSRSRCLKKSNPLSVAANKILQPSALLGNRFDLTAISQSETDLTELVEQKNSQSAGPQGMESDAGHGRAKTSSSVNAIYKTRVTTTFKSNARLRKNHLLASKVMSASKLPRFGKNRLDLGKSSAEHLLQNGVHGVEKTVSVLDPAAKVDDIAKALKHPKNVVDKEAIDEISSSEVSVSHLKSSVGQYFGAANKLARGERFRILGRRMTPDGLLQYHIEWEGGNC